MDPLVQFARAFRHVRARPLFFMWANSIPRFNPQRISRRSLVSPPGGSGVPHGNSRRFPEPPHGWVLVQAYHLTAAVNTVGTKTRNRREAGRFLDSPKAGY
ncbi:hypothetical protein XU18_0423 [Perkinsela sp. CCAP 1560/4]|nr:hypothetical protein XU18_0423 [Perkinsela sp. CCAP 1560/4]|eukprot:KNH09738.1 hypothetical protein XU18_0423 [Perkinsela sp. CCAP 1560/4]